MAFSSSSSSSFSAEINVTPLIDVLLVLLIIFMVIVPVIPRGVDSAIPEHGKKASTTAIQPTVLSLAGGTESVAYAINARAIDATALRSTLAGIFSARQDRTIFLQADRSLNYEQVAYAIGEAKAAGAQTVAFMPGKR